MKQFFVDLHIHIGRADAGLPVKITAARTLTVAGILEECITRKGIDMVGIVDASAPPVQADLQKLAESGDLREMPGGGLRYKEKVTLILGSEVETTDKINDSVKTPVTGCAHCLCYFPYFSRIRDFTGEMSQPGRVKNIGLSSQKCNLTMQGLWEIVNALEGIMIPAHAFTPHKGVYGNCVRSIRQLLTAEAWEAVPAVELGLSSDSNYADMISELAGKTFLSNSDAHSLPKIGREYNIILMEQPDFAELVMALRRQNGRKVIGNYGYDPKLGKYHRTYCQHCRYIADETPPVTTCAKCGREVDGRQVVMGVIDRICQIRDNETPNIPEHRPVYRHQIPLEHLPGIGPKTLDKLLGTYTEMEVLHKISRSELTRQVGEKTADLILLAREGRLEVSAGGGGRYGRVMARKDDN